MSFADKITACQRQTLWYRFTKALLDKRILYKNNLVTKFEVFGTLLCESEDEADMIVRMSRLLSNQMENFEVVWKWKLLGYKTKLKG